MQLELSQEEHGILIDLVESRARELHPTIRRSRVSSVTDELKHDLEAMTHLLEKLQKTGAESESVR